MIGIGIDAVDIERFRRLLERRPKVMERIFTESERERLAVRADPVPGLAARFAAKEAAMKALGTGLGGVRFADVEIVGGTPDAPHLNIKGLAAKRAEALGLSSWAVSLTHTDAVAMAVVVAV
ncbi:MAG: holo-ACP synthase [Acidimicrobiales bacterium]